MLHDIHVHIEAAEAAEAELDHHEQLHAAMHAEYEQTLLEIRDHKEHLAQIGVDHDLRCRARRPPDSTSWRPPDFEQGAVLTPAHLYEAVPHLGLDSMISRIGVDDGRLQLATLPDFVATVQSTAPSPGTQLQQRADEDDASSSASSSEWDSRWEEVLDALDQSIAQEAGEQQQEQARDVQRLQHATGIGREDAERVLAEVGWVMSKAQAALLVRFAGAAVVEEAAEEPGDGEGVISRGHVGPSK